MKEDRSVCAECGHEIDENLHGPDSQDYDYNPSTDSVVYGGSCTYCKVCNPSAFKEKA